MPVGSTGGGDYSETRVYLKPKGFKKQETEVYFQISEYKDGKVRETTTTGWVTAYLDKIVRGSYQHQGDTFETVTFELVENGPEKPTRFFVQMGIGGASRELLNRLAKLAYITTNVIKEMITIGVYCMESSEEPGKYYKGCFLKYGNTTEIKNQQKIDKLWSFEKLKEKTKKVQVGTKTIIDYTELDKFYDNVIEKIVVPAIERFELDQPAGVNQDTGKAPSANQDPEEFGTPVTEDWTKNESDDEDDLPF